MSKMENLSKNETKRERESSIIDEIKELEEIIIEINKNNLLNKFKTINYKNYNPSIQWISNVCNILKFTSQTLFQAIEIYKKIKTKFEKKYSQEEEHLISIISILISSKLNEVAMIGLRSVIKNFGKNKFSKEVLIEMEMSILKKLNFKVPVCYFESFLKNVLNFLELGLNEDLIKKISQNANIFFTFLNFSDEIYSEHSLEDLYLAVIIISLKMMNKYRNINFNNNNLNKLFENLRKNFESIYNIVKKIKIFVNEFNKKHHDFFLCKELNTLVKCH
jgi:hypothetical protein